MIQAKAFHQRLPVAMAALGMVGGLVAFAAEQPAQTGVHTASQAESGRAVYRCWCANRYQARGNPRPGAASLNDGVRVWQTSGRSSDSGCCTRNGRQAEIVS